MGRKHLFTVDVVTLKSPASSRNKRAWFSAGLVLSLLWMSMHPGAGSAATVAYYRFDNGTAGKRASGSGSILDSSGNGLNGTPFKSPVYSSNVPATAFPDTLSMAFGGSGQMVGIPDYPALALTHSLTLEAYVNVSSVRSGLQQYFVFRGDDRNGLDPYSLSVQINSGTNVFKFLINDGSGNFAQIFASIPASNQWFGVAGTLDDATGAMKLYVNGVLQSSLTTSIRPLGTLDSSQAPGLGIGNVQDPNYPTVSAFNGLVDEVRISDQALSPSQFLVPEPSAFSLLVIGAIGIVSRKRRRSFELNQNDPR